MESRHGSAVKQSSCSCPIEFACFLIKGMNARFGGFWSSSVVVGILVAFFPSFTANVSFWVTLALNFTRYAKSQKDRIIGQVGLPILMGPFTFVGLAVTASTQVIFGHVISNPIELLGEIGGVTTMILSIIGNF